MYRFVSSSVSRRRSEMYRELLHGAILSSVLLDPPEADEE